MNIEKLSWKDLSAGMKILALVFPLIVCGTTTYSGYHLLGYRVDKLEDKSKIFQQDHDTIIQINERVRNIDGNVQRLIDEKFKQ